MVTLTNTNGYFGKEAGTALEYDFSQISWKDSGTVSDNPGLDLGIIYGHMDISGTYNVDLGLTGKAHLDLGHMDTSMDLDGAAAVVSIVGQGASFHSGSIGISNFTIDASGPDAAESYVELGVHAALKFDATVSATAGYDVFFDSGETSGEIFSGNLIDIDTDFTLIPKTTLDMIGGLDGNVLTVALGEYFEGKIDLPEFTYDDVEHQTNAGQPDTLTLHGESSPFATLEFGLASFLGLGPWGESVELGFVEAGVEAGLFDAKLTAEATLVQDVTVESEIDFSMTTTLNDDVTTGKMGDDITFDTPEGEGDFDVSIDYTLVESVDSTMSLKLNSYIDWKVLFGAAYLSIPSISEKLEFEFSLIEDRIDLGDLLGLSVSFELTHDVTTYTSDAGSETFTVHYENFVTKASGAQLTLTTHQILVFGGKLDNVITGNDLDNALFGGRGDDSVYGNGGNDRLNGGQGTNLLDGGAGRDTVVYSNLSAGVDVELSVGMAHSGKIYDSLTSIENVVGTDFNDYIGGDAGDNKLTGLFGDDTINGGDGNDVISGGAGTNYLDGGDGIDTLSYATETFGGINVTLGLDSFATHGFSIDVITHFENLTGSRFDDTMAGDGGDNQLIGGDGNDQIFADAGNDRLVGGTGADTLDGGDGIDTVGYAASTERVNVYLNYGQGLFGGAEGDVYSNIENAIGSNFDDLLNGDDQANALSGLAGNDFLYGEVGNDTLDGGAGDDQLEGGDGNDTFVFSTGHDTVVGDQGNDTIIFAGNFADYAFAIGMDGRVHVSDALGNEIAYGYTTEFLNFADVTGVGALNYLN